MRSSLSHVLPQLGEALDQVMRVMRLGSGMVSLMFSFQTIVVGAEQSELSTADPIEDASNVLFTQIIDRLVL